MKKLILMLLFSIPIMAQVYTSPKSVGDGIIIADSLKYVNTATGSDSVHIIDLGLLYDWVYLLLEGNSNTTIDSITVEVGYIGHTSNRAKTRLDTIWTNNSALRDSAWGLVSLATGVSAASNPGYLLMNPVPQLIRLSILNHRGTLVTRTVHYHLAALRNRR